MFLPAVALCNVDNYNHKAATLTNRQLIDHFLRRETRPGPETAT